MAQPKLLTLPNGVRAILVPQKEALTATVLVMVAAGCEHEAPREYGIAHFLEHMCFKGTHARPTSQAIVRELEGMGAETNAFTGRRYTGYWAKAHKRHVRRILDVVADLYRNPRLPEEEIEKEKGVIVEEINMYEDQPRELADLLFDRVLYGAATPEGHPIVGSKETVRSFTRDDFLRFRARHYHARTTWVVVAGAFDPRTLKKDIAALFGEVPRGTLPPRHRPKVRRGPTVAGIRKKTEQTHLVLGVPAFGLNHKDVPVLAVLATVLGKGMASRLFHRLREEMGVAYYAHAALNLYEHYGSLTIHAGVTHERLREVVAVIREELTRLTREPVSARELSIAKNYREGMLLMGLEATDDLALYYALQAVQQKKLQTPRERVRALRAVTAQDIQRVARALFRPEAYTLTYVGPPQNAAGLRRALAGR